MGSDDRLGGTIDRTVDRNWAARGRRAGILVTTGLGIQVAASLHWTPLTFILSAAVGLPLVAVGVWLFARVVWGAGRGRAVSP